MTKKKSDASNVSTMPSNNANDDSHTTDEQVQILRQPNQEILQAVVDHKALKEDIADQREDLNNQLKNSRTGLATKFALNLDAVDAAIAYVNASEKKQENFDLSYIVSRRALGHPLQTDMFVEAQINASTAQAQRRMTGAG